MSDFGGKLRQARERRGISLRQIAASTKISVAALEALERNHISRLPGGIFSRAFVRSYAIEVGLDPDETVREFLERFQEDTPVVAAHAAVAVPEQESQFENQQRMASVLLKLVLVSVPLIIVILYFTLRSRPAPQPPPEPPDQSSAPEPAPPKSSQALPPVPAPVTPPARARPTVPAPARTVPVQAGQPLKLDLHPTGPCWISLTVDGERLFARVMQPGEHESRTVQREAVIEIGDAGAFDFSINGRPGRSLGAAGQVKTAKITPTTAGTYLK